MSLARRPMVVALVVFALALPACLLLRSHSEPHYRVSASDAVAVARADAMVKNELGSRGYTDTRVTPLDSENQRVGFFRGPRLVLVALVGPNRTVIRVAPGAATFGNRIANLPALYVSLALAFILAMATVPLFTPRNLDVLAFTSFTIVFWLSGRGLLDASMWLAYPLLGYLVCRFLWIAARGSGREASTSLYWRLTMRWSEAERRRTLRVVALGLVALTAILTVSSSGVSDVAYASLAGATDLLHGTVPYGHMPSFIVHGDTYPPLTYVTYVPAAVLTPVTDAFSDPQGALILTALAALLTAVAIYRLLARSGGEDAMRTGVLTPLSEPPDIAGLRGAIAWLAFPPVLVATSGGFNDIVVALCLVAVVGSIASARRSTLLLGVAAWVKLTPVFAIPVWIARMDRREALRAVAGLAALSAAILGGLIALGGLASVSSMADGLTFQFERRSLFSLWSGPGLGPVQAATQAALVASVVGATLAVRRDPAMRDDPLRLAAILAALMLLSQLASNYWTWAYVPWAIAPALLVLAPAAGSPAAQPSDAQEPAPMPGRIPIEAAG